MKIFSVCSGIGGFEVGIQNAYKEHDKQATIVGFSEIDKYAISVYVKHFGGKNYGDITKIVPGVLPNFDCFVGGFPCQSFSVAGKRKGFDDARGTIFFDIARILQVKQPKLFILENVKGLLNHDGGRTFKRIIATLAELGYCVEWQVCNSKHFGVPQSRERVFIVGHFGGQPERKVFPIIGTNTKTINQLNNGVREYKRVYSTDGLAPTLNTMQGGQRQPKIALPVLTPDRANKRQNGRCFKIYDEPMFTLTAQDRNGVYDGQLIRRLTPLECERLQGFADGWTETGCEGEKISDSQRYKMLGNAVTTNVVQSIFKRVL